MKTMRTSFKISALDEAMEELRELAIKPTRKAKNPRKHRHHIALRNRDSEQGR